MLFNLFRIKKEIPAPWKKYYTEEVAERLETIVDMAKELMQEIAIIDYPNVA